MVIEESPCLKEERSEVIWEILTKSPCASHCVSSFQIEDTSSIQRILHAISGEIEWKGQESNT